MEFTVEVVLSVLAFAGGIVGVYVKLSNKIAHVETELKNIRKDIDRERSDSAFNSDKLNLISNNLSELRVLLREKLVNVESTLKRHERDIDYLYHKKRNEDEKE